MHGGMHWMNRMGGMEEELLGPAYNAHVVRRLWKELGTYRKWLIVAVAAVVVYSGTVIALPYLIGSAIDNFITFDDVGGLTGLALAYVGISAFALLLQWGQQIILAEVGQRIIFDLRQRLFAHLQVLSLAFIDKNQIGRLISRVQSDISQMQEIISGGLLTSIGDMLSVIGIVIVMMTMNWKLALAVLAVLPVAIFMARVWQPRAVRSFRSVRRAISDVNAELQENISGVRAIQALSREEENARRFDDINTMNMEANLRAGRLSAAVVPAVELLTALSIALIVVYGGSLVFAAELSAGELVTFALFIQRLFDPIREMSLRYTQLQAAMTAGERVFELLDVEPDLTDAPDAIELPELKGRVDFDHVHFEYVAGQPVLRDISLVVAPGETIALVGPTGAGKSTFVNLIPRFYDVKQGSIRIDGHDLRSVTQESLRRQIALVLQEPVLFSGTLRSNLYFGKDSATDEELWSVLETVGLADAIRKLPNQLDSEMGERGSNLSLGQRQLVSFARALLADPKILILDEATASIDTHTEQLIKQAMAKLQKGRTSFVIAHRLATVRDADRIVVIDDGRIVEIGNHGDLLERRGQYYDLYTMAGQTVGASASDDRTNGQESASKRSSATI